MSQAATFEALTTLFREFFMDDSIVLTERTTSHDVAGWDSLTMISLVLAIQRSFVVTFSTREQSNLRCVGDLASLIDLKRERAGAVC